MVLAGCETMDGGISLPWTLGWLASTLVFAFITDQLSDEDEEDHERHVSR